MRAKLIYPVFSMPTRKRDNILFYDGHVESLQSNVLTQANLYKFYRDKRQAPP